MVKCLRPAVYQAVEEICKKNLHFELSCQARTKCGLQTWNKRKTLHDPKNLIQNNKKNPKGYLKPKIMANYKKGRKIFKIQNLVRKVKNDCTTKKKSFDFQKLNLGT